ncbi:MAG: hypothetical protein V3S22_05995 [Candidatus Neomarinimicrobiota bacterium]
MSLRKKLRSSAMKPVWRQTGNLMNLRLPARPEGRAAVVNSLAKTED